MRGAFLTGVSSVGAAVFMVDLTFKNKPRWMCALIHRGEFERVILA